MVWGRLLKPWSPIKLEVSFGTVFYKFVSYLLWEGMEPKPKWQGSATGPNHSILYNKPRTLGAKTTMNTSRQPLEYKPIRGIDSIHLENKQEPSRRSHNNSPRLQAKLAQNPDSPTQKNKQLKLTLENQNCTIHTTWNLHSWLHLKCWILQNHWHWHRCSLIFYDYVTAAVDIVTIKIIRQGDETVAVMRPYVTGKNSHQQCFEGSLSSLVDDKYHLNLIYIWRTKNLGFVLALEFCSGLQFLVIGAHVGN